MKRFLILSLILLPFSLLSQGFDKGKLDKYLDIIEANDKAMFSLAIAKDGNTIYENSIGYASIKDKLKNNSETKFRIGSISKVFTTVMIFQLIEEGKLSLDTKLDKYYPKVKNADRISIANLLNHSSGIFNFTNAPSFSNYMVDPKSKKEIVTLIESLDSDFEPGTSSSYSNSAFVLLGFIVEDITKANYTDQVNKRIINKLGLTRTEYGGKINPTENQAYSFDYFNGIWVRTFVETDMTVPGGAGAMVSRPKDLNVFIRALFEGELVSQKSLDQMKTIEKGYGKGLFLLPFGKRSAYGHGGAIDQFKSNLAYFEEENIALAITINGATQSMNDILIGILSIVFNEPFELPKADDKPIELSNEVLAKYVGTFSSPQIPLKIVLKVASNTLQGQATGQGPFSLSAFSETEFRFEQSGIVIKFEIEKGLIDYKSFTLLQGGGKYKFTRE